MENSRINGVADLKYPEAPNGEAWPEEDAKFPAFTAFGKPWPEVEVPKGWKKNPRIQSRATWVSLLALVIAGGMIIFTGSESEFVAMIFFVALLLVPMIGTIAARWGVGMNYRESRELHTVDERDVKLAEAEFGWRVVRYSGPYQKLEFPREISGQPVVQLAEGLFGGRRVLAYVHLPEHITEVPDRLFERCDNLPAIMLPVGVRRIGQWAFGGCTELRDVYIPATVVEIAPNAFQGCRDLILHVREGSAAEAYAKEQDILYSYR